MPAQAGIQPIRAEISEILPSQRNDGRDCQNSLKVGLTEPSGSFLKPSRCVDNHRRKRMNSTIRVRNELTENNMISKPWAQFSKLGLN